MKKAQTFVIDRGLSQSERTIEAVRYGLEGDYWVFCADLSQTKKVLTIRAALVDTIARVSEE